jgi:predicted AAA+ superfamily ATPase
MKLFKREKILKKIRPFYEATDIIKVITGVRRSGKSTVLELIKRELISNGVPASNIIDIDLDSKKYKAIKTSAKLEKVIDDLSFNKEGLLYLFIDEIQNVHDFEEVINAYRGEGNYSIFITGSNSYLLSGELVTKLTGRYLEFELFTLSFDEYVEMKKYFNQNINENLILELQEYIIYGGFPRALLLDEVNAKRTYTSGIVKEIFEKDIKRRVKVRNVHTFEIVTNFIVNNFGATISVNSIRKSLLNTGIRVSHETINRYIQILKDAKIIYECERFDTKSKRALAGEKKYYLADLSFYFMLNTNNEINYGPCLENIVYIYARSLDYAISVGRIGKLECDFILRNNKLDYSYVQVAYTILSSKETADREYRPLEAIKDNYAKYVLTTDYLLQKRGGIIHANIMDFMTSHQLF